MRKHVKRLLLGSIAVAVFATTGAASAGDLYRVQRLSGIDTIVTSFITKSKIAGTLEKDASGYLVIDANGNFKFNFSGDIFYPVTSPVDGELKALYGPSGTVNGQAAFPPAFASLAIQVYAWLQSGGDPSQMPAIPAKIDWTMNDITIVQAGTTYRPINTPGLTLEGRAFTGIGPAEIGQVLSPPNGLSLSVRMGGCFGVEAVSGPHAGKVGTYCLNSTFTFDLTGINLSNPMTSTLNGTGTSNCWTVLHKPLM